MPKRIPTPPPGDDEPRYLTVVHPYAISGTCNMELQKDRQDFARWVACCIDKDAFFAVFHKPSSRGMVIVEIKRDYAHFDRILGEHRWSEFLQNPTKEEKDRVTQVFYCTYSTGRQVQKNGWKRIDVDEAWFKAWSSKNRNISFPYPSTHFCDVPVEDHTRDPLCRPLPGAIKPPPPDPIVAPQPVVGSAAWIQSKEGGLPPPPTIQAKPNSIGAWGQGAPKSLATVKPNPTANGSAKKIASIFQGPHTGTRMPAVGGGQIAVKTSNVWQNTVKKAPPTNWDESAPASREGTPALRGVSPAMPPGLPASRNAWESGATSYPTQPPGLPVPGKAASVSQCALDRAGNFGASSWDSAGASTSSPDTDSGPDLTTATESDNPYSAHIHFSESMEEEFHGMGIRAMGDEEEELRELDSVAPGVWDGPMADGAWETAGAAGWDDDALDAEDQWNQVQETTEKPILCNAHGTICKKGICAEYARQLRQNKRLEEAEKRKTAAANRGKKGARPKGRGSFRKEENQKVNAPSAAPPNNAFRGPGAPVKTNWRGTPRAIVSADTIEKRETTRAATDDWDEPDSEGEPVAAVVVPTSAGAAAGDADAASDASWGVSEGAFDPWAAPSTKPNNAAAKRQGNKVQAPGQTKVSSPSWADQVDAELGGGDGNDAFMTVSSKRGRGSKRGGASTTSWGTSSAKTSTSGWGSVPDMPW